MAKKISQNIRKQLGQFGENIFETASQQPEKITGVAMRQEETKPSQTIAIEQLKQQKAIQTRRQIAQLEREIGQMVADRKKQQEAWHQAQEEKMASKKGPAETKEPPPVVPSKPKRGLLGFWGRRVKTAQEQTKPEMVGKKVGG